MGQTAKVLRASWRRHYTHLLDSIFEEFASQKIRVTPDVAMDLMDELTERHFKALLQSRQDRDAHGSGSILRFDYDAYRREAHLYAVTRFYKTYFPRKRGAPPLPASYLDRILRLRFKGLNYVAIAEKMGQPKGKMRKQVPVAERLWRQAVDRIEQMKRRFPHLVAAEHFKDQKMLVQRSKRQTVKIRRGK